MLKASLYNKITSFYTKKIVKSKTVGIVQQRTIEYLICDRTGKL